VRLLWSIIAAVLVVTAAIRPGHADTPTFVLGLLSYPASLLAEFLIPIVGQIDPPEVGILIIQIATGMLGFFQWFLVIPSVAALLGRWHHASPATSLDRGRQGIARMVFVLIIWAIAELVALGLSTAFSGVTSKLACGLNAIVFHAWVAIPMLLAAVVAAFALSRLWSDRTDVFFWNVVLAAFFLLASLLFQAVVFLDARSMANRVGVLIEVVLPAALCVAVGLCERRQRPVRN
jgi:hypothetical protein